MSRPAAGGVEAAGGAGHSLFGPLAGRTAFLNIVYLLVADGMHVRIFTLKFHAALGGFDDGPLRDFTKDKEVLSIRDHFFIKDELPYLAVLVTYNLQPATAGDAVASHRSQKEVKDAWRALLEEGDWPLFNTLREWRNEQARKEGIPPYVICTNRQLATIAHRRPSSLNQLAAVEGLGKAKLERYGAAGQTGQPRCGW